MAEKGPDKGILEVGEPALTPRQAAFARDRLLQLEGCDLARQLREIGLTQTTLTVQQAGCVIANVERRLGKTFSAAEIYSGVLKGIVTEEDYKIPADVSETLSYLYLELIPTKIQQNTSISLRFHKHVRPLQQPFPK